MEFEKIFLTQRETEILSQLTKGAVLQIHSVDSSNLLRLNFISKYALSNGVNEFVITSLGLRYYEYVDQKKKKEIEMQNREYLFKKRERIATWVSIIVSNAIALLALIVSILK